MKVMAIMLSLILFGAASASDSPRTLSDGISSLAEQIAGSLTEGKQHRVAVVPLMTLKGETSALGAAIAEEVATQLASHKVQVIERGLLTPLINELRLEHSGAIDSMSAKRVGKLVGADAIVTGTIIELPTMLRINCRVIATETGDVLAGAHVVITIDADVRVLMDDHIGAIAPSNEKSGTVSETEPALSWKRGDIRIVVDGTDRGSSVITLVLALEHGKTTPVTAKLPVYHLIDENGDRYNFTRDSERFVEDGVTIPPGTRARSSFFFHKSGGGRGTKFSVVAADDKIILSDILIPRKR